MWMEIFNSTAWISHTWVKRVTNSSGFFSCVTDIGAEGILASQVFPEKRSNKTQQCFVCSTSAQDRIVLHDMQTLFFSLLLFFFLPVPSNFLLPHSLLSPSVFPCHRSLSSLRLWPWSQLNSHKSSALILFSSLIIPVSSPVLLPFCLWHSSSSLHCS